MTFEQGAIIVCGALVTALTFVVGGLCFLFKILWKRSEQCEKDRRELRLILEKNLEEKGMAKGELKAYQRCPEDGCPFRAENITSIS